MKTISITHGDGSTQFMQVEDEWEGDPQQFAVPADSIQVGQRQQEFSQRLKYLSDTDWYVARKAETGVEIPQEVLANRVAARQYISENRAAVEASLNKPEAE